LPGIRSNESKDAEPIPETDADVRHAGRDAAGAPLPAPIAPTIGEFRTPAMREPGTGFVRRIHPHAWLWEPLEDDATFVLRAMFGTRAAYLDGKLMLCFSSKADPWRGVLVCTEREYHASLVAEFPSLSPHAILPKWLYLAESADDFERVAEQLVALAKKRDPRIGVIPKTKRRGHD
jgi:hypothetical protein